MYLVLEHIIWYTKYWFLKNNLLLLIFFLYNRRYSKSRKENCKLLVWHSHKVKIPAFLTYRATTRIMQSKGCYICNTEPPEKFFFFCFIAIYLLRNKKPKNQASIRQDRQWNLSEHNMLVIKWMQPSKSTALVWG